MSGFGSVERSERSGGLKMRWLSRIGVLSEGSSVLGERGGVRDVNTKKPAGCVTGRAKRKRLWAEFSPTVVYGFFALISNSSGVIRAKVRLPSVVVNSFKSSLKVRTA